MVRSQERKKTGKQMETKHINRRHHGSEYDSF